MKNTKSFTLLAVSNRALGPLQRLRPNGSVDSLIRLARYRCRRLLKYRLVGADRTRLAFGVLITLASLCASRPARAQFPFKTGAVGPDAGDYLRRQLEKAFGEEAPFVLDPNQAFQQIPAGQAPTAQNFKPKALKTTADMNRPLPPGDYSFNAMFYCTQWSVHRPGRGLPYTIGRAQGRLARQMSALLYRGTVAHVSPATLNAMAWRIQAGVPLRQWSDPEKALVHKLVPDAEKDLDGDWLQRIKDKYNKTFRIATRKSFEDELKTLGALGQLALNMEAAHETLTDTKVEPERLPDLMFQRYGTGGGAQLPDDPNHPSPWMRLEPGVMARFTVEQGNLGSNLMELRVSAQSGTCSAVSAVGPTVAEIMNGTGADEGRGLVGYSSVSQSPVIEPLPAEDSSVNNKYAGTDFDPSQWKKIGDVDANETKTFTVTGDQIAVVASSDAGPVAALQFRFTMSARPKNADGSAMSILAAPEWLNPVQYSSGLVGITGATPATRAYVIQATSSAPTQQWSVSIPAQEDTYSNYTYYKLTVYAKTGP